MSIAVRTHPLASRLLSTVLVGLMSACAWAYPPIYNDANVQLNQWTYKYSEGIATAARLNRPVMIAFVNQGYCSYCAQWDVGVLSNSDGRWNTFLEQNPMVLIWVDQARSGNYGSPSWNSLILGNGIWPQITAYPTIVMLSPQGGLKDEFIARSPLQQYPAFYNRVKQTTDQYPNIPVNPGVPGTIGFTTGTAVVSEGAGKLTVTVSRTGGCSNAQSFAYATVSGTAQAGVNFTHVSGTLTWADGNADYRTFTVPLIDDHEWTMPTNRTFLVTLEKISGDATVGTTVQTVTITEASPYSPGSIGFATDCGEVINERASYTGTVMRTGGSIGATTGTLAVAGHTVTPSQLVWANGDSGTQTFVVPVGVTPGFDPGSFTITLRVTGSASAGLTNTTVTVLEQLVSQTFDEYKASNPANAPLDQELGAWFYNSALGALRSEPLQVGGQAALTWTAPGSGRFSFKARSNVTADGVFALSVGGDTNVLSDVNQTLSVLVNSGDVVRWTARAVNANFSGMVTDLAWEPLYPVAETGFSPAAESKFQIDALRANKNWLNLVWQLAGVNPADAQYRLYYGSTEASLTNQVPGVNSPTGGVNTIDLGIVQTNAAQGWVYWRVDSVLTDATTRVALQTGPVWRFAVIDLWPFASLVWSTGGDAAWFGQIAVAADGGVAAQSGAIGDSQSVWLQANTEGKGTLGFTWRVSSESGRDFLRFTADGQPGGALSGESGWQTVTFAVTNAGPHTFRWTYSKGKSGSAGADAAWLDQVAWTPVMTAVLATALPAEGGTVTGGGACVLGSSVTLVALPNRGWRFDRWENGETNARRTFTVPEGRVICTAHFVQDAIPLAEALDTTALSWTTGGDAGWNGWVLAGAHDGDDAAQSGLIGDLETSRVQTAVTGPGTLSFWWRVSCEEDYDYLDVAVDGSTVGWLTGESGWRQLTLQVEAGPHTVVWDFWKDESESAGADAAWLDQVVWQARAPSIAREPQDAAVLSGETVTLSVAAEGLAPLTYQWFAGQSGATAQPIAGATNATFTTPPVTAGLSYWVQVANANGTAASRTARIGIGFPVATLADLQKIGSGINGWTLGAAYRLANDIDASGTALWNDSGTGTNLLEGFAPIGAEDAPFTGIFDGRGHLIRKLVIRRSALEGVGLFGCVETNGSVQNVGVIGPSVTGYGRVGALVGQNKGLIARSYATGQVTGYWSVGGAVGENNGTVAECFVTGAPKTGAYEVGGLAGYNDGTIRYCYALTQVLADLSFGDLVGADWGSVEKSYRPIKGSGPEDAQPGTGVTIGQMRQQATFTGWSFGTTWGIQEGDGTPYLQAFAEGKTIHLAATPTDVYPAAGSSVWSLRPVVTASVAVAGCDLVSARWQVSQSEAFSAASDWMGVDTDADPMRSPVSSRLPNGLTLEPNKSHFWRVKVQTGYGMWSDWSQPVQFQVFDPAQWVADGKDSLRTWLDGLQADEWKPDALLGAQDNFMTAVELDGENLEARLYRAMTTVLTLAENQELRDLLGAFGYAFDESLLTFTGRFAEVASPLPNEGVDRVAAQTLPAIQSALADLAVIPTNWTGTVAVSPVDFPVDEEVFVDCADVLAARAMLNAAKTAVEILQSYDLTADYAKTNVFRATPSAAALAVTLDGDEAEWSDVPVALYGEACQLEYVKIARSGTHLYLLARLAEGISPNYFEATIKTSSNTYWVGFSDISEGTTQTNGSIQETYQGGVLELAVDLDPAKQGETFSLHDARLEYRDSVMENRNGFDEAHVEKRLKPFADLLADHPACLSAVRNAAKLASAQASLTETLRLALASDAAVRARTGGQMHFIEYDPAQSGPQSELRQRLRQAQASMTSPQLITCEGREHNVDLGAFFNAPYVTRSHLPQFTADNELICGTFPDPTFTGILPGMTQAAWQSELTGLIPIAVANAFSMDGRAFTAGGYGLWDHTQMGSTNFAQSGSLTKKNQASWVESTFNGPGTLTFSWAVSSQERVNNLSVYIDGVRQTGSISGDYWGPRTFELASGTHKVRWLYRRNAEYYGAEDYNPGPGLDTGYLSALEWSHTGEPETSTTGVPVPYSWLDSYFTGLSAGSDYEAAALADQDNDGVPTWQEYVAGTVPTNRVSALQATITKAGSEFVIGWAPDLRPARLYAVEGKATLPDAEWSTTNAASRFFRVKVWMP